MAAASSAIAGGKLQHGAGFILPRPLLEERLDETFGKRLTLVVRVDIVATLEDGRFGAYRTSQGE
jgi:hypothetical protein